MELYKLFLIVALCLIGANYSRISAHYESFKHWAVNVEDKALGVSVFVATHVIGLYIVVVFLAY